MARSIAAGIGLAEFPFDGAAGFWRFVDLCEAEGVDSPGRPTVSSAVRRYWKA